MLKSDLSGNSVPRVELDQRARAARVRHERVERLLLPAVRVRQRRLRRRLLRLLAAGAYAEGGGPGGMSGQETAIGCTWQCCA